MHLWLAVSTFPQGKTKSRPIKFDCASSMLFTADPGTCFKRSFPKTTQVGTFKRPFDACLGLTSYPQRCITHSGQRNARQKLATDAHAQNRVAAVEAPTEAELLASMKDLSYSDQYDIFFGNNIDKKKLIPKPSREAQAEVGGAKQVPLSDVYATLKRRLWTNRSWEKVDIMYSAFMLVIHGLCLFAPATFSWPMVGLFFGSYFVTGCLGITLSYHRQLSHRSFQCPKWLEYIFAYCGVLAVQGDPIEWASSHRYHHLHCDTPMDPHSPYEGFWWSHAGWVLDNEATLERVGRRGNTGDLEAQPFYTFMQKTYNLHIVAMFAALYALGGFPAVIWGGALRVAWVWHVTWFVNSASHCWGSQTYNTGDLSRNNWWVGLLAFGEGWHNNHHAFEFSAQHGLERWQFDMTWVVISTLKKLGLATNVKLPTEKQKARLAYPSPHTPGAAA